MVALNGTTTDTIQSLLSPEKSEGSISHYRSVPCPLSSKQPLSSLPRWESRGSSGMYHCTKQHKKLRQSSLRSL